MTKNKILKILGNGDIEVGRNIYLDNINSFRCAMSKIYYSLKRCLSKLYSDTKIKSLYASANSFINSLKNFAFTHTDRLCSIKSYEKMRAIKMAYEGLR